MINKGFFMTARKIEESAVWQTKPAWWLKVWLFLIKEVSHQDTKDWKRGQGYFTYSSIHFRCKLSVDGVKISAMKNLILWFKLQSYITTVKTTRGFIITVLNYNTYQDINSYKNDSKSHTEKNIQATQIDLKSHTINKNVVNKNVKNTTESLPIAENLTLYKAPTSDLQRLVLVWKTKVEGFPHDDREWDKLNFDRCAKSAKALLGFFKDFDLAAKCLIDVAHSLEGDGLDYSIETIVRRASMWQSKRASKPEPYVERYYPTPGEIAASHGEEMVSPTEIQSLLSTLKPKVVN